MVKTDTIYFMLYWVQKEYQLVRRFPVLARLSFDRSSLKKEVILVSSRGIVLEILIGYVALNI